MSRIDIHRHISSRYVQQINDICRPLFESFGLNYFDYGRFYPDGSMLTLYSDPEWVNCFINDLKYITPTAIIAPGSHLWQAYIDDQLISVAKNNFAHEHGITLCNHYPDYHEVFNYSAPPENRKILDFYLNHTNILHQFNHHFLKSAEKLINTLKQDRLKLIKPAKISLNSTSDEHNQLLVKINSFQSSLLHSSNSKSSKCSPRELECLTQLAKGLTAKEIGVILNISNRTVERHVENLKVKLGVRTSTALINQYFSLMGNSKDKI